MKAMFKTMNEMENPFMNWLQDLIHKYIMPVWGFVGRSIYFKYFIYHRYVFLNEILNLVGDLTFDLIHGFENSEVRNLSNGECEVKSFPNLPNCTAGYDITRDNGV